MFGGEYLFAIDGIVWESPADHLPSETEVWLPAELVEAGLETFVEKGEPGYDDIEYDLYRLSQSNPKAMERFEEAWDIGIKRSLQEQYGVAVVEIDGFEPAEDTPWRAHSGGPVL